MAYQIESIFKSFFSFYAGFIINIRLFNYFPPARDNVFQFRDVELLRIRTEHLFLALYADRRNRVNLSMPLESLQRVDDDRPLVDGEKLLGNVLVHSAARIAGYYQCYVRHSLPPATISFELRDSDNEQRTIYMFLLNKSAYNV